LQLEPGLVPFTRPPQAETQSPSASMQAQASRTGRLLSEDGKGTLNGSHGWGGRLLKFRRGCAGLLDPWMRIEIEAIARCPSMMAVTQFSLHRSAPRGYASRRGRKKREAAVPSRLTYKALL